MSLKSNRAMVLAAAFAATAAMAEAGAARGNTITWMGGVAPSPTSWNEADNWGGTKPTDEAQFTDTGTSGSPAPTISLDASQTINQLTIATTNGFTIGSADDVTNGNTLTLTNVNRQDVSGTESAQTIAAPVTLGAASQWTVNGSNYLNVTNAISGSNIGLEKLGSGELRFSHANNYTGTTTVTAGKLTLAASGAINGNVVVGGGTSAATLSSSNASSIAGNRTVTVKNNGTFDVAGNGPGYGKIKSLDVEEGGKVINGNYFYLDSMELTGGSTSGTAWVFNATSSEAITTNASAVTAKVTGSAYISINNNYYSLKLNVDDGAAPIDLEINAAFQNNGSAGTGGIIKNDAGTVALTKTSGSTIGSTTTGFTINGGTLLVNNTSGSGTGKSKVQVNHGATLGGMGIIGGVSGYTAANVSLSGSAGSYATLAPGSIDATSGGALIGQLTIGSETQNNNITFGNYSQLLAQLGNAGQQDVLEVHGDLDLSGLNDLLSLATLAGTTQEGLYTLATFTGTLTGRFDQALLADGSPLPTGWQVEYLGTDLGGGNLGNGSIVVAVPEPGMIGLAALGLLGCLRRRRRA